MLHGNGFYCTVFSVSGYKAFWWLQFVSNKVGLSEILKGFLDTHNLSAYMYNLLIQSWKSKWEIFYFKYKVDQQLSVPCLEDCSNGAEDHQEVWYWWAAWLHPRSRCDQTCPNARRWAKVYDVQLPQEASGTKSKNWVRQQQRNVTTFF